MSQAISEPIDRQARPLFGAPDILTVLRVPLAGAFVLVDGTGTRLGIVAVAAASDLIDGMWARRIGGSRAGVVLDPVCDKVFMAAAFFFVYRTAALSLVAVVGVLLRDIVAAVAFVGTVLLRRPTALPARAGGKIVTLCQLSTLLAVLQGWDFAEPLAWSTAAISLYAIHDYVREGLRR